MAIDPEDLEGFTEKEVELFKLLTKADQVFKSLPKQHPQDDEDWAENMNRLREKLLIRPTVRENDLEVTDRKPDYQF